MLASAQTKSGARDGQLGSAIAVLGDRMVLSIQGAYLFALENDNPAAGTGLAGGVGLAASATVDRSIFRKILMTATNSVMIEVL